MEMLKGLIGKKIGMTQIFDETTGAAIPVTLIEAGPCYVTQVRLPDRDGYSAVQLGYEETKSKRLSGGQLGHLKRNNIPPLRFLREFRTKSLDLQEGDTLTVDVFAIGEIIDVVGTSKGSGTTPGRVFKGARGPGHMGNERVTAQHLKVVLVDPERNLLGVRGAVPGSRGGVLMIKESRKQ
jgi:large subunit ribosomal protein L3